MKSARDKNYVQKNQMKILKLKSSIPKVKKFTVGAQQQISSGKRNNE